MYLLLLLISWWFIRLGYKTKGEIGRIVFFFIGTVSFVWGLAIARWEVQLLVLLSIFISSNSSKSSTQMRS